MEEHSMTNYILIYDDCCFYEIVLLGYFMRYSNMGEQPCSYCMAVPAEGPHRDTIRTAEGFRVQADTYLEDIDPEEVTSFIIPGGDISRVRGEDLSAFLHRLNRDKSCICAICAGVDLLEEYGFLEGKNSIRTSQDLAVSDGLLVTARPNGYVDFAVEAGKAIGLFTDEADIAETLDFFKFHKSES